MYDLTLALSLNQWGDIAEFVIAVAAGLAFFGAAGQLWLSRASGRRGRVYQYADRFNTVKVLRASAKYKLYWESHSYDDFLQLDKVARAELNMLPNLIEEVAWLYNRNLLDRNLAAELLGVYVEALWAAGVPGIMERRSKRNQPTLYAEWDEMQRDTPRRQQRGERKSERRRARRRMLRGA